MIYQKFLIYFFQNKLFIIKIGRKSNERKNKKIIKNRIFIFTVAALLFGTIGVSATTYFPSNDVTYDNTESGLTSTDVQGAIDELYNTCSNSKTVEDGTLEGVEIVDCGDGLYEDNYEEGRYVYKGTDPNNYIAFNNNTWRIISLESDGTLKSWVLGPIVTVLGLHLEVTGKVLLHCPT